MPAPTSDTAAFQPPLTRWAHTWRLLVMAAISAGIAADALPALWDDTRWRVPVDAGLGLAAFVLVQFRRRWPLVVALAVLALATFSTLAAGPAVLATVSLATRRLYWQLAVIAVVNVVSSWIYYAITPTQSAEPTWITMLVGVAFILAAIGWGMYIGSRRELLWTLRHRAERAEAERDLRVGKAQSDERARIAREMHDVLAHRISQVSMHAGALAFRTDLDSDQLRAGIAEVQTKANDALSDLRNVLGVLRDPDTGTIAHRPQPTYDDLPALVADARSAGARLELDDRLEARPLPAALGRTLYRIVQEGITNAHKHAPGAVLRVAVSGGPDDGVEVSLRNPIGFGPPAAPGAGLGLVGLAERVELAGGVLSHGRDGDTFVVRASLPWSA
ncbi:MAG TPA: histidine kinase [Ilumatobacter sp.]|nr:histidine kinase [Ilumatobacter sp.]